MPWQKGSTGCLCNAAHIIACLQATDQSSEQSVTVWQSSTLMHPSAVCMSILLRLPKQLPSEGSKAEAWAPSKLQHAEQTDSSHPSRTPLSCLASKLLGSSSSSSSSSSQARACL